MSDGEIELRLAKDVAADPTRNWLRTLHYDIVVVDTEVVVGRIEMRIGYTYDVEHYGGHLGYYIKPEARGNHFAARACKLLKAVAREFGMDALWITCSPENDASRKTCELIGARLIEIVNLPADNDQYLKGHRQKCRYQWVLH